MNWYLAVLKKYAVFRGRARRKELWMFYFAYVVIVSALFAINFAIRDASPVFTYVLLLYVYAHFIPGLAVSVRRLHDTGHSGWWLLVGFVPIVGSIILLVFSVTVGEAGPNEYGPNPKDVPI